MKGSDFQEYIGPIDIKDNVFIGSGTRILYNVTIGPNTIVAAGSLVNKCLNGGVYAGVPAKYVCSFDEFVEKRSRYLRIEMIRGKNGLSEETVAMCWERFREQEKRKEGN